MNWMNLRVLCGCLVYVVCDSHCMFWAFLRKFKRPTVCPEMYVYVFGLKEECCGCIRRKENDESIKSPKMQSSVIIYYSPKISPINLVLVLILKQHKSVDQSKQNVKKHNPHKTCYCSQHIWALPKFFFSCVSCFLAWAVIALLMMMLVKWSWVQNDVISWGECQTLSENIFTSKRKLMWMHFTILKQIQA